MTGSPTGSWNSAAPFSGVLDSAPQPSRGLQSYKPADFRPSERSSLPPGSYINPNFQRPQHHGLGNTAQLAAKTLTDSDRPIPYATMRPSAKFNAPATSPPNTAAGHKRKLEAVRGPPDLREKKPGPQVVPPVPVFGGSVLPHVAPSRPARTYVEKGSHRPLGGKHKSNNLGLTPLDNDPEYSDSGAEDGENEVDEEAMFAELGARLTFEYEGAVMSLTSEADLARWQQERRRRWPTSTRVKEKEEGRRAIGNKRKRLLAGAIILHDPLGARRLDQHQAPQTRNPEFNHTAAEKLAEEVERVEDGVPEARRQTTERFDDSSGPRSDKDRIAHAQTHDNAGGPVFKSLPGISMDETDEENDEAAENVVAEICPVENPTSYAESRADSEDDVPEESSSKGHLAVPDRVDRPACRYFFASGRCRDGDACKYRHEASAERPFVALQSGPVRPKRREVASESRNTRKGIHQLLQEQEQSAANRQALQAIRYLGNLDFFEA